MTVWVRLLLFCVLFIWSAQDSLAQSKIGDPEIPKTYQDFHTASQGGDDGSVRGGPGTGDPCFGQEPGDPVCPIDNEVYILLGIGLIYGMKRIRDSKKAAAL